MKKVVEEADALNKQLTDILKQYRVNDQYIGYTVWVLKNIRRAALDNSELTDPPRFKEVNIAASNKELGRIIKKAKKLLDTEDHDTANELLILIKEMSHTSFAELFYSAHWQHQIALNNELSKMAASADLLSTNDQIDPQSTTQEIVNRVVAAAAKARGKPYNANETIGAELGQAQRMHADGTADVRAAANWINHSTTVEFPETLKKKLLDLVEACSKIECEREPNKFAEGRGPKLKVVVRRLSNFLEETWKIERGHAATISVNPENNCSYGEYLNFAEDIFSVVFKGRKTIPSVENAYKKRNEKK